MTTPTNAELDALIAYVHAGEALEPLAPDASTSAKVATVRARSVQAFDAWAAAYSLTRQQLIDLCSARPTGSGGFSCT